MVTSEQAKKAISEGLSVTKSDWPACKKIRLSKISDYDYFNADTVDPTGLTMVDCKQECDCNLAIFRWTKELEQATDWIILY